MANHWAEENLKVIRTLMERAALYRRALAPITLITGGVGVAAAILGNVVIQSARAFTIYWLTVSLLALIAVFLTVRWQSLKAKEAVWSPPTRRVVQALAPALFGGFTATLLLTLDSGIETQALGLLPPLWMIFLGCALHASGFFMPRGMKLFGWGFILIGCLLIGTFAADAPVLVARSVGQANWMMGITFGGFHIAYGVYLYFTENRKNET